VIELKNTKKYELIANRIEEIILESGMKVGDRLSSVNELTKLFNVAPATTCNSLNLLRDRKIIISMPRKGNFIERLPVRQAEKASDFASYLEGCHPLGSIFTPRRKTLSVCIDEYRFSFRKQLWDKIFSRFSQSCSGIEIKVMGDRNQADAADIVLTSNHLLDDSILDSSVLRKKLFRDCVSGEHYLSALNGLSGNNLAVMPFAISQQMRLLNCNLLERHCPGLLRERPERFITYISDNYDFKSPKFPPLATFIHFLPLTLTEEGAELYDPKTGKIDFSDERIPKVLEFNRCMSEKLQKRYGGWENLSTGRIWEKFLDNKMIAVDSFSYAMPLVSSSKKFKILAQTSSMKRLKCSITVVQMLGITKNCRNVDAAADFTSFACGREGQFILAQSGCNIPVLRHCAESDVFLEKCPENMRENLRELDYEKSLLDFPVYNISRFHEINDISVDYYSGKITLKKALDSLKNISCNSVNPKET
jgi:DNA-binding transcriptional regulator YhcF (GntR family)